MSPPRTRIKFCGITRPQDAVEAIALGVDYLGMIFVPHSPRALLPEHAVRIREAVAGCVPLAALFQNATGDAVQAVLQAVRPAILQFHGGEDAAFCQGFGLPWIKAVPMGEPQVYADWEHDHAGAMALLADSHTLQGGGGSGHRFDWLQLPSPPSRRLPLMLAGGLTAESVAAAVRQVRPWGVDVSSGIESAKGIKDPLKMRAFVDAVRAADASSQP